MFDNPKYKGEMYQWSEITLMPGVVETLPMLAKKYQCAVVSNALDSNAETMKKAFERMGIDHYFKLFITSKEIGYKKPDERFFTYIANLLNMPPEMLCMVGNDYDKDIVTPKKLGMSTILITSVIGKYYLSDKTVDSFSLLRDILT
ncbi:MAG TPA: HAD-IA family hydrolase [Clostridiales bacterium]|nr:HAD-IA family hydrolase [Clostridiales bacterium]